MSTEKKTLEATGPTLPEGCALVRLVASGEGAAAPGKGPLTVVTSGPVTLVGSRRDCDLPLHGHDVSKLHCAIVHDGQRALLCDLSSRTGTHLNGRQVRVAPLRVGDRLRVADFTFTVEDATPPGATPPPPPRWTRWPITVRARERVFELSQPAALIGRRSTCDIVIDTPDVSLAHALLFVFRGRPALFDLGSRSGSFVNQAKVHLSWVQHGDVITIGGENLTVSCPTAPGSTEQISAAAGGHQDPAGVRREPREPIGEPRPLPADAPAASPVVAVTATAPPAATPTTPKALMQGGGGLARTGRASHTENARSPMVHIALRAELDRRKAELDAREADLARREAELLALKGLLELEAEHVTSLSASLARQSEEVRGQAAELEARWQVVREHEETLADAWSELAAWHARFAGELKLPGLPPSHAPAAPVPVVGGGLARKGRDGTSVNPSLRRADVPEGVWTARPLNV